MVNKRRIKDEQLLNIAHEIGKQSKCVKHSVGTIICRNDRLISSGYNGTPSGFINCNSKFKNFDNTNEEHKSEHREWSAKFEIHSEMNALIFAGRENINVEGCVLYCTLQPCHNCLKHMVAAGIKTVIYKDVHKSNGYDADTMMLVKTANINLLHYNSTEYNDKLL